jgi:lipopolysaccharide transport system permease protein
MRENCQMPGSLGPLAAKSSAVGSQPLVPESRHTVISDLHEVIRELWQYRELLCQFVLRDLRVRYKQSVMGFAWTIFMPAMVVFAGIIVKFAIGHVSGTAMEAGGVLGLAVKALLWAFFVGSISFATASIVSNESLVTKNFFPREVFPLSSVVAQSVDSMIAAIVLLLVLPLFANGPSVSWLWLLVLCPAMFCLTSAMALSLSCGNLFFRDVKYIVQVLLTFGIFFTPVFFEPSMFGQSGSQLMMLNPLAPVMEGVRLSLVEGHNLLLVSSLTGPDGSEILVWTPWYLVYSLVWAVLGLIFSSVLFHRCEFLFAEYV